MIDFNLDEHIVGLLRDEPFFAALSRRMEKVATKSVPTAGVKFNEGPLPLLKCIIIQSLWLKFTSKTQVCQGVLLHEFYHIVLLHVTTRIPGGKMTKKWNIATDLAINSELSKFEKDYDSPSGYVIVSSFYQLIRHLSRLLEMFAEVGSITCQPKSIWKCYQNKRQKIRLKTVINRSKVKARRTIAKSRRTRANPDGNGFDDHSDWGDSDGTDEKRKIAEERLKESYQRGLCRGPIKGLRFCISIQCVKRLKRRLLLK